MCFLEDNIAHSKKLMTMFCKKKNVCTPTLLFSIAL